MNRAVFFDRDGVLNELVERDGGYYSPRDTSSFTITSNAAEVTRRTSALGYLNIVISNQPDVARGYLDETVLQEMTSLLLDELTIDDVLYCVHDDPDLCSCRKPAPGLFIHAVDKWKLNVQDCFMIGDTWKDVEAARNANITSLLLDRIYNMESTNSNRITSLKDIFSYIG